MTRPRVSSGHVSPRPGPVCPPQVTCHRDPAPRVLRSRVTVTRPRVSSSGHVSPRPGPVCPPQVTSPRPGPACPQVTCHRDPAPRVLLRSRVTATWPRVSSSGHVSPRPGPVCPPQVTCHRDLAPCVLLSPQVTCHRDPAPCVLLRSRVTATRLCVSSSGHVCDVCGRRYKHRDSLVAHAKVHAGVTTCHVCGAVSSNVQNLRQHLETVHRLKRDHVRAITRVPGLQRGRQPVGLPKRGQM